MASTACVAAVIAIPCQAEIARVALPHNRSAKSEKRAVVENVGALLTANYIFPDRAADAKAKIDVAPATGDYDSLIALKPFA